MKKFNDFDKVNENKTTNPKVWKPDMFLNAECRLIKNQLRKGLKLYHLDGSNMVNIPTNMKSGKPYKLSQTESGVRKVSLKENPYGVLYFLTDDELNEIVPLTNKIKEVMELMDKKKDLLVQLIGSTIQDMSK